MTLHRFWLALSLLGCLMLDAPAMVLALPVPSEVKQRPLVVDDSRRSLRLAQSQPTQAPATPPAAAASAPVQSTADEPIGNVVAVTGIATVIRNKNSLPLKLKDDIFLNDIVQTSSSSSLGITFNDATTFNLSANAKITIDNFVYEDGGKRNAGIFDVGKGTVAFVAAAVAKTGDMTINTPTASLGIRGTTGLVEIQEGAAATTGGNNIKLYPDADGRIGRIEVNDRQGARLGTLTQGASGFAIRPGVGGGRATAVPLTISPQQAARDQGFVRQVHAAQTAGRQIVNEQRALRRANPNAPGRGNQPGPQRQNQLPGQNRPGQPQQGAPNRQGQQKQQPGLPNRQGDQRQQPGPQQGGQPRPGQSPQNKQGSQPAQPRQGTPPSAAPGLQRPGALNRPALPKPRLPALPKGKQKEKR